MASTSLEEQPSHTKPSVASKSSTYLQHDGSHTEHTQPTLAHHQDNQQDGSHTGPLYFTTFEPATATPTGDQVITQAASERSFDPDSLQVPAGDSEASTDSLSCVSMEEDDDQSSLVFTSASMSQQSQQDDTRSANIQPVSVMYMYNTIHTHYTHTYTQLHTHIHVHTHTYARTQTHTLHTHTHTHTTYTHTHTIVYTS